MTNYKHLILQEENEFPRLFADVCERDWGVLFFRTDNKNSHDSNHVILYIRWTTVILITHPRWTAAGMMYSEVAGIRICVTLLFARLTCKK